MLKSKYAVLTAIILPLIITIIIAVKQEKGFDLLNWVTDRPFAVRTAVFYGMIFAVILFGIYGTAYDASSFIYLQF